ncbi:MAG: DUF2520 domain-containing protein [Planctomycetota bacterium]
MSRGTVGLIGAGAVGPVITKTLVAAGWTPGTVASRTRASAESAVAYAGGTAGDANADAARGADLLVIAVPDRAIETVAAEVAPAIRPGALAIHLSGAHSSDILAPLRVAGADTGSLHPLQSFADRDVAYRCLSASFHFFEGSDPERVRDVAADLGGRPVPIRGSGKVLYHAGAAAACNLAVAMVDVGVHLMGAAGIEQDDALAALLPLLAGTLGNLETVGLPAALTGPVARGDVETVARHVNEMRRATPDLVDAYAAASLHAVEIALAKGTIDEEAAEGLRRALALPRP